jgi:large conductance mechanosensitive channel
MDLLQEFKKFLLRGNVIEIAVGIVVGTAFNQLVQAFVRDILTPIISIPGTVNFSQLSLKIGGSIFSYGDFLNLLVSFLVISASVFFVVVKPVNYLNSRRQANTEAETKTCQYCVSEVPIQATKCKFCTSELVVG